MWKPDADSSGVRSKAAQHFYGIAVLNFGLHTSDWMDYLDKPAARAKKPGKDACCMPDVRI